MLTHKEIISELEELQNKAYFYIKGTAETPEVLLNSNEGKIRFSGRSLPENPKSFFIPIKNWLAEYAKDPVNGTRVVFELEYFNTSSSKMILDMLDIIRTIKQRDENLVVEWHYLEDDDDMLEAGEDFADVAELELKFFAHP